MVFFEERIGKLLEELGELRVTDAEPVRGYRVRKTDERFADVGALDTSSWDTLGEGGAWGGKDAYYWFDTTVEIPARMAGKCVLFHLYTGADGWDARNPQLSAYVDGALRQGLDVNHRSVLLAERAEAGRSYRITLSAYTGDETPHLRMEGKLITLDRAIERYYYDVRVPWQAAKLLPHDDEGYIRIIQALNDSLNLLDLRRPYSESFYATLAIAQDNLAREFYEKICRDDPRKVFCVGHTHIDVAWWWTLDVTKDKSVRSFSTMLALMDEYPEYRFMSSQPQLYKYVRKYAPESYARIKERVREGRWEPEGAMFVEADCNVTSGESLVRQILHGKRFFRDEFGRDCKILWLPDVFGYSAALPQIMRQSGIDYFMTTKLGWNEINKMPYDTFVWEGMDGTRILTHFSPTRDYNPRGEIANYTTYNALVNPSQVKGAWQRYQQKSLNSEILMIYGYGDGGGGPTREMLENQRRLAKGIPGCPQTVISDAREFFAALDKSVSGRKDLPAWVGELYLEYHRGTYTGMARNKRYNRRMEFAYLNCEWLGEMAAKLLGDAYPREALLSGWEIIERNQFHDILPGSSIKQVYEDSLEEYRGIEREVSAMTARAMERLAEAVDAPEGVIAFNPNDFIHDGEVFFEIPKGFISPVVYDGENPLPTQITHDGRGLFTLGGVPAKGYKAFTVREGKSGENPIRISTSEIDTPFLHIEFDGRVRLSSVYDKRARREVLKAPANVLMTYEDKPHNYDAWDVNNYYDEKSWEIDDVTCAEVIEQGPVRACLRVERRYLESTFTQTIIVYAHDPRVDFESVMDWRERQIFVKALFPVDIQTSEATYEIQYGNVKRPTHRNTSWDFARFEVCHHKWLDLSEDGYGVSLLNDCKYGAHVHDGVIGLSLLKSAISPNPDADKERHVFTYSLLPHQGGWRDAGTVRAAYALNNPVLTARKMGNGGALPKSGFFAAIDAPNVILEVVKRAEDGEDAILRAYECYGRRTETEISLGMPAQAAFRCNLMEEEDEPTALAENRIPFTIKPYEIVTFKVR